MKIYLLSFLIFFLTNVYGQLNQEMIEVFGQEKVDEMKTGNPGLYEVFDAFSKNGIEIINTYVEKYESAESMPAIIHRSTEEEVRLVDFLADLETTDFNILKYNLFPSRQIQIYKLESGKYLKIESQQNLLNTY